MNYLIEFLARIQNIDGFIQWGGYAAIALVVFSETGLFVGFFLPGDSLLVTAGLFAARGDLNIFVLLAVAALCAIVGDATGFEIGRFSGKRLFSRPNSRFFKRKHLEETHRFYEKHGGKTIILARFMPVVRTFAPLVAGVAGMSYPQFATFNIIGGVSWVCVTAGLGFFLGRVIPNVDRYITLIILLVVFFSILPGIIEYARSGHWKRWFERSKKKN